MLKNARYLGYAISYQQILINVLENAVKFSTNTEEIKVIISGQVMESQPTDDSARNANIRTMLSVIVQDNGIGIRVEDQDKLFQPFETLEDSKQLNPNGTGLGLYVSKLLCE